MAFPRVPEGDVGSPMNMDRDDRRREMSVVSMDDPDVRLAAEALSGLGNPGGSCSLLAVGGRQCRRIGCLAGATPGEHGQDDLLRC